MGNILSSLLMVVGGTECFSRQPPQRHIMYVSPSPPRALLPSSIPRQKLISPPILCIYCNALFRSNIPRRRGWLFHGPDASPLSADNRQCIVRVRVRSLTIAAAPQPHQSLVANKSLSKDPESFSHLDLRD